MFKFLDVLNPLWAAFGRQPLPSALVFAILAAIAFYMGYGNTGTFLAMCTATLMIWRSEQDQPLPPDVGLEPAL